MQRTLTLVALTAALAPRPTLACGPGVHILEASRALELLAAGDPVWAERAAVPRANSYLWLGSISPDFEWPLAALGFGHGGSLGLHLLDLAEAEGSAERALFALGHVAHMASDPACEMFHTPTFFASEPLGLFDLMEASEGENARAEAEGIVEGLGDLVLGDWIGLVDTLYDFWLEGDEAKARAAEIVGWYCRMGAERTGRATDCDAVWTQLSELLGKADELLGGNSRDEAKGFMQALVGGDIDRLVTFYTTGLLELLGSSGGEKQPWYERELARMLDSALVDPAFWSQYDGLAGLGPQWTFDRVTGRLADAWPGWEPKAMICGNVQSVMRALPEDGVVPGLIVDDLRWTDAEGHHVWEVRPEQEGAALQAHVRFYSSLPFEGRIRAVVRKDGPGLDATGDEVLGDAGVTVEIDPLEYATTARTQLTIPFDADPEEALGYYVELYASDGELPWFTTSWDRLWTVGSLDLDGPAYRDHFGTYGHWPPSLPRTEVDVPSSELMVKVFVAPAGRRLAQAEVVAGEEVVVTGDNGLAVFGGLAAGGQQVHALASGYFNAEPATVDLAARSMGRLDVPLHAIVDALPDSRWLDGSGCVGIRWDPEPLDGQAAHVLASACDAEGEACGSPIDVGVTGAALVCGPKRLEDGAEVVWKLQAEYEDGSLGPQQKTEPVGKDTSPAALLEPTVETARVCGCEACDEVTVGASDPHSGVLAGLEWRFDDEPWPGAGGPLEAPRPERTWDIQPPLSDEGAVPQRLFLRVRNGAGLLTEVGPLALVRAELTCGPLEEEVPLPAGSSGDSGCALSSRPGFDLPSRLPLIRRR